MVRIAAILVTSSFLVLAGHAASCGHEHAQINVSVYNDAGVSPKTLAIGQQRASQVLQAAGIYVRWNNVTPQGGQSGPLQGVSVGNYSIRIVDHALTLSDFVFGVAFLGPDGSGRYADVFYGPAAHFSEQQRIGPEQVLGHVMAHELGHLLLGTNAHSANGVMNPHWSGHEIENLRMGRLLFTQQQSYAIRARLRGESEQRRETTDAPRFSKSEALEVEGRARHPAIERR